MAVLGGNNDTGWEGHWYKPDEPHWLKRRRRRNESRTGQTMQWQRTHWGGLSHFDFPIKSSTYTHGRIIQTTATLYVLWFWDTFLTLQSSSLVLLSFDVQVPFVPKGGQITGQCYALNQNIFLHAGWYYWKLSGSLLFEQYCRELCAGPAWGLVQHSSALTTCISLSCGPWPPDAFPDPGNRINTSAQALGSHSRIHSCALA